MRLATRDALWALRAAQVCTVLCVADAFSSKRGWSCLSAATTIMNPRASFPSAAQSWGDFTATATSQGVEGWVVVEQPLVMTEGASSNESPPSRDISDAEVNEYFASSSSSDSPDDICGPHQDCCGGSVCSGAYTSCVKRLGKGGFQHPRGQVCCSTQKYFQCATCKNVAHSGCWVRTAKGSFVLPLALTPFHCYTCDCNIAKENQLLPVALPIDKTKESVISNSTAESGSAQTSADKRIFMSEAELRKYCKERYWECRSSAPNRMYYICKGSKGGCDVNFKASCDVTFKARKSEADDTWFVENMPTCHSCSSATPEVLSSLVTLKDHLSEALVKEIERLGVSKSFRSKQIQNHLLSTEKLLVDTKLIHNIVYRVRQKLFGHDGDMIHLLEQQKVA